MGTTQRPLHPVKVAPGHPGQPYILPSLGGETIYIPCSKSATRLLVTGKETDNAFAVVGTGGAQGDPIGFHYHRETHDVFLCLKGKVNVWANDQCRTMESGDFASVPPGTVHQYQILGEYTEFVGLIVPGGWEEFFRFIGEPYDGPMFPLEDDRNVFEVLIPKLKAASEKFDMIPVRDPKLAEIKPQTWSEGKDNALPGGLKPYFLRAGTGPKFLVGGLVVSPLATGAESGGRFSIGSIEGSSWHEESALTNKFTFDDVHHAFQVADGSVTFSLDDTETTLNVGETIYVPRGRAFSITLESRAGKPFNQSIPPEKAEPWEKADLEKCQKEVNFRIVE
ncbi:hypothetical protein LTR10_013296 [Elasticomyces elasticus]|nr:hypothetical protein LTR10_013296 [Elasticomyces elasticus]KAK5027475.1 hypothetical protein LTS07_007077 [Exophiala sideris]KAK5034821.1 hypothetical protein LTR13_006003 [Exophiala sideris]KAK5181067.1 hypothetical protein LTR44_006398 [Eurotiomycetes sp. CCFEE 6388]